MVGAHSSQTVLAGGSSSALSRALAASSVEPVGLLDEDDGPAAVERTLLRDRHEPAYVTHA